MTSLSTATPSADPQRDFVHAQPSRPSPQGNPAPIVMSSESRREAAHQVAKLAARLNASAVSDEERAMLLAERQQLLDKELDGSISRKEAIRLRYVRWSLDRIEDAKHGPALDKLESRIEEFRKLAEHIEGLREEFNRAAAKRR